MRPPDIRQDRDLGPDWSEDIVRDSHIAHPRSLCYNHAMNRFVHIVLILLLTSHGWAEGAVTFACRMSGEVSSVCCCASAEATDCDVIESAQQCCDVHVSHTAAIPAGLRPSTPGPEVNLHPAWVASASVAALLLPRMPEGYASAIARQDSASPPPLILLTQSIRC